MRIKSQVRGKTVWYLKILKPIASKWCIKWKLIFIDSMKNKESVIWFSSQLERLENGSVAKIWNVHTKWDTPQVFSGFLLYHRSSCCKHSLNEIHSYFCVLIRLEKILIDDQEKLYFWPEKGAKTDQLSCITTIDIEQRWFNFKCQTVRYKMQTNYYQLFISEFCKISS